MPIYEESSLRDGYQPFSRQTFSPLQQPGQYDDNFSQKPSSASPTPPSSTPSRMAPSSGPNVNPMPAPGSTMTFAQLQTQGIPRPAPPVAQPVGSTPVGGALQQSILDALGNPSRFGAKEAQDMFGRLSGQIDDEYTLKGRQVDEQMAARGFYDSTMAGGQLHDLNVGRRSAKTDLAQRIAESQAQTYGQDRASAIQQALGFMNQEQQGNQFDRDLYARQGSQENALLLGLLQALGGGELGSLFSGAQTGTLGPSVGGVGGPGGWGFLSQSYL